MRTGVECRLDLCWCMAAVSGRGTGGSTSSCTVRGAEANSAAVSDEMSSYSPMVRSTCTCRLRHWYQLVAPVSRSILYGRKCWIGAG